MFRVKVHNTYMIVNDIASKKRQMNNYLKDDDRLLNLQRLNACVDKINQVLVRVLWELSLCTAESILRV